MSCRELSNILDVKVDTKERNNRNEFLNYKNWTRFHVKIEAIQCFPCYVKVALFRPHEDGDLDVRTAPIIRITVPGLHIQMASSRTKEFTYGFFWKANRKRCSIFLAFDSAQQRSQHMAWVKDSMKYLERYRQEFLEIRRASRYSTELGDPKAGLPTDPFSNYQNLGPLPPIPRHTDEYSRRQSTVSGIYEEIPEVSAPPQAKVLVQQSIYESVQGKKTSTTTTTTKPLLPPPLPPRQRINTLDKDTIAEGSGPHTGTVRMRKYKSVLESIFGVGQHNQLQKVNETVDVEADGIHGGRIDIRNDLNVHPLTKNKRNSFSTPELANWTDAKETKSERTNRYCDGNDDEDWQDVSCLSLLSESLDTSKEMNISQKILPNFNLSHNNSATNLVGCNFNAIRESELGIRADLSVNLRLSLNQVTGYCVMKPIQSVSKPVEEKVVESGKSRDSVSSSGYCRMNPGCGFDRTKLDGNEKDLNNPDPSIIQERADDSLDDGIVFQLTSNVTLGRGSDALPKDWEMERELPPAKIYENCNEKRKSQRFLVDDKIPSYFPNSITSLPLPSPPPSMHSSVTDTATPPKLLPKQKRNPGLSKVSNAYSPRAVPNIYSVPRNNSPVMMGSAQDTAMLKQSLTDSITKLNLIGPSSTEKSIATVEGTVLTGNCDTSGARDLDKNVKLDAASPVKYTEKCTLRQEFASFRRFASLPRFRKLDLSPLKIKLTNVLQRHNSEY